jgi:hypothetical protein
MILSYVSNLLLVLSIHFFVACSRFISSPSYSPGSLIYLPMPHPRLGHSSSSKPSTTIAPTSSPKLLVAAIAGIAVIAVAVILLLIICYCCCCGNRSDSQEGVGNSWWHWYGVYDYEFGWGAAMMMMMIMKMKMGLVVVSAGARSML